MIKGGPQEVVRQRIDGDDDAEVGGADQNAVGVGQVGRLHAPGRVEGQAFRRGSEVLRPDLSARRGIEAEEHDFAAPFGEREQPVADRQRRAEEALKVLARIGSKRLVPAADFPAQFAGARVHGPKAVVVQVLLGRAEPVPGGRRLARLHGLLLLDFEDVLRVRRER